MGQALSQLPCLSAGPVSEQPEGQRGFEDEAEKQLSWGWKDEGTEEHLGAGFTMAGVADIPDKDVTTEARQAGKRDTAVVPACGVAQRAAFTPTLGKSGQVCPQTPGCQGTCAQALGHTSLPRDEPELPLTPAVPLLTGPHTFTSAVLLAVSSPAAPPHTPSLSPSPAPSP